MYMGIIYIFQSFTKEVLCIENPPKNRGISLIRFAALLLCRLCNPAHRFRETEKSFLGIIDPVLRIAYFIHWTICTNDHDTIPSNLWDEKWWHHTIHTCSIIMGVHWKIIAYIFINTQITIQWHNHPDIGNKHSYITSVGNNHHAFYGWYWFWCGIFCESHIHLQ